MILCEVLYHSKLITLFSKYLLSIYYISYWAFGTAEMLQMLIVIQGRQY